MEIRLLNRVGDLDKVNAWLAIKVTAENLPGHTYGAFVGQDLVAIGALRMAEGPMCIFDSMATDQSVTGSIRNEALDALTKTILEKAKELGFKAIMAWTVNDSIMKRAAKHGFKTMPQILIVKEL